MADNKDMEMEYTPDIVNLTDDEGNEYTFEVLDAIESEDGRYLAMLPIYDDAQKQLEDSGELVIVKVGEENGEEYLICSIHLSEKYDQAVVKDHDGKIVYSGIAVVNESGYFGVWSYKANTTATDIAVKAS